MTAWHSLYLLRPATDTLSQSIGAFLGDLGYQLYNPFGLMPARPYRQTMRLFVAPPRAGWVRLVGEPDAALLPPLSQIAPVVWLRLAGDEMGIDACADGTPISAVDFAVRAQPSLRPEQVEETLRRPMVVGKDADTAVAPVDPDTLTPGGAALADKVDLRKAGKLFDQWGGKLIQRAGGDMQAAQALMQQPDAPNWSGSGGARLRAYAELIGLPDGWAQPDFGTLRDAYHAAARRQRKPDLALLPTDRQALDAVPDALDHVPVFGGKDT